MLLGINPKKPPKTKLKNVHMDVSICGDQELGRMFAITVGARKEYSTKE